VLTKLAFRIQQIEPSLKTNSVKTVVGQVQITFCAEAKEHLGLPNKKDGGACARPPFAARRKVAATPVAHSGAQYGDNALSKDEFNLSLDPITEQDALQKAMEEKSREFTEKGAELYAKV